MDAIKNVKAHYLNRVTGDLKKIPVAEWDIDIYVGPLTVSQQIKLEKSIDDNGVGVLVDTLIYRAVDKQGNALFGSADREELLNFADADVISRIVKGINKSDSEQGEGGLDAAKKPLEMIRS